MALASAFAEAAIPVRLVVNDAASADRVRRFIRRKPFGANVDVQDHLAGLASAVSVIVDQSAVPTLPPDWDIPYFITGSGQAAPEKVALYPAAPPHMRRLIELCPGARAPVAQIDAARTLLNRLEHCILDLPPGQGSALAVIWRGLERTIEKLLLEGGDPFELDEALVEQGWQIGLFEMQDLIGLDRAFGERRATGADPCLIQDRMVQEGRLGHVTGVGWYRYPGGGGPVMDPLIEDLIREEAHFARIPPVQRSIPQSVEMLTQTLCDTGAELLEQRILSNSRELDQAMIDGIGVPEHIYRKPARH